MLTGIAVFTHTDDVPRARLLDLPLTAKDTSLTDLSLKRLHTELDRAADRQLRQQTDGLDGSPGPELIPKIRSPSHAAASHVVQFRPPQTHHSMT